MDGMIAHYNGPLDASMFQDRMNVTSLIIVNCVIPSDFWEHLVPIMSNAVHLNLSRNIMAFDTFFENLCIALKANRVLRTLILNQCGLGGTNLMRLIFSLRTAEFLEYFSLINNFVDSSAALTFVHHFMPSKTLKTLDIRGSGLDHRLTYVDWCILRHFLSLTCCLFAPQRCSSRCVHPSPWAYRHARMLLRDQRKTRNHYAD